MNDATRARLVAMARMTARLTSTLPNADVIRVIRGRRCLSLNRKQAVPPTVTAADTTRGRAVDDVDDRNLYLHQTHCPQLEPEPPSTKEGDDQLPACRFALRTTASNKPGMAASTSAARKC